MSHEMELAKKASSVSISGQSNKPLVFVVPRSLEGVYVRLLLRMRATYAEWPVEGDTGYLLRTIDTLLEQQLEGRDLGELSGSGSGRGGAGAGAGAVHDKDTQYLDRETVEVVRAILSRAKTETTTSRAGVPDKDKDKDLSSSTQKAKRVYAAGGRQKRQQHGRGGVMK